ncbi:MAG TPA: PAS domain S-box protein [Bacteroidales bacterium]|nr:PAS domain S-box protein [Bacteroidales bacterium]HRX97542.1 PAS domain S-box protein [Bacteroidales bacterium]
MTSPEILAKAEQLRHSLDNVRKKNSSIGNELLEQLNDLSITISELFPSNDNGSSHKDEDVSRFLNWIQAGIMIVDFESRKIEYLNDAALSLIGNERKNTLGRVCHKFVCPSDSGKCPICDLGVKVDKSEKVILNKNGQKVDILKTVNLVEINGKKKLLESFFEITELKQAQATIGESEAKFRELFNNLKSGVIVFRYDDSKNTYVVSDINKTGEKIIHRSKASLLNKPVTDTFRGFNRDRLIETFAEIGESGEPTDIPLIRYEDNKIRGWQSLYLYKIPAGEIVCIFNDITDRVNNESGLQKLSQAIEQSPVSVVITDIDGRIEYVNPFFTKVTGYTAEEAIGNFPNVLKSGEQNDQYYKDLWTNISNGKVWEGEFVNKNKKGEVFCEKAVIAPIFNTKGKITNYIALKQDVTSNRRTEIELQKVRSETEQFLGAAADGLRLVSIDGIILKVNKTFLEMTKLSKEEVIGKKCYEVIRDEDCGTKNCTINQILSGVEKIEHDVEMKICNGEIIHVISTIKPFFDLDGNRVGYVQNLKDISQRIADKKKLEDQFQFMQTLLNTIPNPIYYKNNEGKYLGCNTAFEKYFNTTAANLIGKTVFDLHPLEFAKKYDKRDNDLLAKGGKQEIESTVMHGSGKVRDVIFTKATFGNVNGKAEGLIGVISDITQRKKMEEDLRASQEEYAVLIENMGEGIAITSNDEVFLFANPAAEKIFGVRKGELIGKSISEFVDSAEFERMQSETQIRKRGTSSKYEAQIIQPGGDVRTILVTATPKYNSRNEQIGTFGIFRDISQRKEQERALRESEERFSKIGEASLDAVIMINNHGNVEYWNPAAARMFGYEVDEIKGKNVHQLLMPKKYKSLHDRGWEKFVKTGEGNAIGKVYELTALRKNGEEFPVEIALTSMKIKNNHWGLANIRDITERKNAEKNIIESEAKYRSIIENMQDVYYRSDLEGNLIMVSPSGSKLLAYNSLEELLGKNIIKDLFYRPEHSKKFIEKLRELRSLTNYEIMLKTKKGKPVTVLTSSGFFTDSKGVILGVEGILTDINERKKHERELRKSKEEAERANRSKSEFLANMSHEIRTPMNAILGFTEALAVQIESPEQQKMLDSVLSSGNLLLALINDILDLSKIEAGKMVISPQPTDLAQVVEEIKLLFNDKVSQKGLNLNLEIPIGFPESLKLDEIRIRQILFNLVGNAVKFTHQGFISIEIDFKQTTQNAGDLFLAVRDSGKGIPASQHKLIFETFQQQEGQIDRHYKGVGLGLAISLKLARKMNGTITVESEEGKGSIFTVHLKNVELTPVAPRIRQADTGYSQYIFKQGNVLVVDDVESNIEVVRSLIADTNLSMHEADSGEMCLELLEYNKPDLILLDIRMPGIGGYETARRIKSNSKTSHIPVIAYTASVMSLDKIKESGFFNGELIKPATQSELFEAFAKFLPSTKRKAKSANDNKNSKADIDKDNIGEVSEKLVKMLEQKLLPEWEQIKDKLLIFKIEQFAENVTAVAEEFKSEYLAKYGTKLQSEIASMDFDEMRVTIASFPKIVKNLLKKKNK